MANPDALNQQRSSARLLQPTVKSHLAYTLLCALVMMVMFSVLRLALLVYNREMILDTPASTFLEAFANGLRFDLRLVVYLIIPLLLALFSVAGVAANQVQGVRIWPSPDNTRVVFDLSGAPDHKYFTLDKPDRLVIDLSNIKGGSNLLNDVSSFAEKLKTSQIQTIMSKVILAIGMKPEV